MMASLVLEVVVFLVLAAGPAAAAGPIGMPGCQTSCGGVDVPYPFGIGPASCHLNQPGFNLTCDRSHDAPRLLLPVSGGKGHYLRVQHIDDWMSTVEVVHTVDINTTGSDDISLRAPFRLSFGNELVLTGCNVRSTLLRRKNKGNATAGCASLCGAAHQGPFTAELPRFSQDCSGADGCCRASIFTDDGPAAALAVQYSVELSWIGRNVSAGQARGPARAFVAKEGWIDDYPKSQNATTTTLDVPVYLAYHISGSCNDTHPACKSNHSVCKDLTGGSYTCSCQKYYTGNAYIPGGCQVDDPCKQPQHITGCYGKCTSVFGINNSLRGSIFCQCPPGTHGNHAIPGGCISTNAGNCTRFCGEVFVPYPFGIQHMGPTHCYHPGFNLICDKTEDPPRLLLGNGGKLRVERIHLDNATVAVVYPGPLLNNTVIVDGQRLVLRTEGFPSPDDTPYSFSTNNELVLTGCDVQVLMLGTHKGSRSMDIFSRCTSLCTLDNAQVLNIDYNDARGQPRPWIVSDKYCHGRSCCQTKISPYSIGGMPEKLSLGRLVESTEFATEATPSALVFIAKEGWFDDLGFSGVLGPDKQPPARVVQEVPISLQWEVLSDKPECNSFDNICRSKYSFCQQGDRGYTCHCEDGYVGNPYVDDGQGCKAPAPSRHKGMIIGISIGVGLASAASLIITVLIGRFISNKVKHQRAQILKQKFFEQNRGQLLQQLVTQRADIAERMIIPLEELEKATNNFDKARELGGGGHGTVYKGILSDLHVVAIKKPKKVLKREIDEFINEVAILSQINHRNVVKLYGCCLETEVPMLVYEFISNGTLYDHLHTDGPRSLSWEHRLRIAIETAKSLAYLHSTTSVPIIHRDVKSANILLDDTLTAKVADFGASRYISVEKSGLTTMVQGTIGYLDPMYFYTGRLTEKSDVYSYGVMLVELLTRKKPFSYLSSEGDGLVAHFVTLFEEGNLSDILDPQVTDEGGKEVEEAIALAIVCIKLRGEQRPTMRQVELKLEGLRPTVGHSLDDKAMTNGIAINSPLTIDGRNSKGSARQYSMEAELTMSSRYPR